MSLGFSANLSMLFTETPWEDRFEAAARAGFDALEIQFPYEMSAQICARLARASGLPLAMINTPPTPGAPIHGQAAQPGPAFAADLDRACDYLSATGARLLHVMAGPGDLDQPGTRRAYMDNLDQACDRAALLGACVVIEPLNPFDAPGYALNDFGVAAAVIDAIGRPNLRLLFDVYHHERIHGGTVEALARHAPRIAHVQIAGAPDRHEPDAGAPGHLPVVRALRALNYDGLVGAEYRPAAATLAGLGWLAEARRACG
jgi:hydroxypyruvate isomerase